MGNLQPLQNAMEDDPLPWAVWLVLTRGVRKLKSGMMALVFHAPGLYLGRGSVVRGSRHIKFGKNLYVTSGLWLQAVTRYNDQRFNPRIEIGDNVCLSHSVHISAIDRIAIGNGVLMGSHIFISDHNHGLYKGELQSQPADPPAHRILGGGGPVSIGDNVWIGDNVVILGPATIGDGAIVAANSLVRCDVPPEIIVAGAPAKPIKHFDSSARQWQSVTAQRSSF